MRDVAGGHRVRPLLELVVAAACWGGGTVTLKVALGGIAPMTLLMVELTCASLVVVSVAAFRGRIAPPGGLGRIALAGVLEPGMANAALTFGLGYASASDASLLSGTESLFVTGLAVVLLGQRVHRTAVLAVVMATAGVIVLGGSAPSAQAWVGNLLVLGGALAAAGYSLLVAGVADRTHALTITAYQFGAGTLVSLPFAAVQWRMAGSFGVAGADPRHWAAAIAGGVLGTAASFLLYNHAIGEVGVTPAAMVLNLIPLFGLAGAVAVLGESLGRWHVLGGVLILAGMTAFELAERATLADERRRARQAALPPPADTLAAFVLHLTETPVSISLPGSSQATALRSPR
jgi:drug/metabolite transporter (DMT)-like permease